MNRYLISKINQLVQNSDTDHVEVFKPADSKNPFISYRYSYKSMTAVDGKTYVNAREERFQDGKLESESFEGVMEGDHLTQAIQNMQNLFLKQVAFFFTPFTFFLPFPDDDKKQQ